MRTPIKKMIDLHCHMLPSIDDGAKNLDIALGMAQHAVADGITTVACTPHIYPGLYENTKAGIIQSISSFEEVLRSEGVALELVCGADVHVDVDLVQGIRSGRIATLNDTRYLLLEFPHRGNIKMMQDCVFNLHRAGYIPIITHPERQRWIDEYYDSLVEMVKQGAWIQLTAQSITGGFGKRALHWSERMLDDGIVHLIATDAHNLTRRPPVLSEGRNRITQLLGKQEADNMMVARPQGILCNADPSSLPPPPAYDSTGNLVIKEKGLIDKLKSWLS